MRTNQTKGAIVLSGLLLAGYAGAQMTVDMNLDQGVYIIGEAIHAEVNIANHVTTPFMIGPGGYRHNGLTFEVMNSRHETLETTQPRVPMIPELALTGGSNVTVAFELDEWYPMGVQGNYIVTAMVGSDSRRYSSRARAIEIVPGLELKSVIQLFADRPDSQRKLSLVYFMRRQSEYLFLRITDTPGDRTWSTLLLGQLLRTTPPTIDVSPEGAITIFHRASRDVFLRTRVKSTASGVEMTGQEQIVDAHTLEHQQMQQIRAMEEAKKKTSHWYWPFGGSDESKTER